MTSVATPSQPTGRRRGTKLRRRQTRLAWLLLLPSLAVVVFVAIYPLGKTVYQSFTNQEFLALEPTSWVGLENYRELWHDTVFRSAVWKTVEFTLITVGLEFALGLAIALVVNSSFKGRGVMRAIMLVPWAIPTVVAAQMWKWMLDDTFGVVNDAGTRLHLLSHSHAWISDPSTALAAVCAVDIWKTTPFVALLLLAGLQVIPGDLYEAADVDGASQLQQFWKITLPLLAPGDPRHPDLPDARRAPRVRRLLRVLRQPAGYPDDVDLQPGHDRRQRPCRLRRRDQRGHLPDHRPLRRHLRDLHAGGGGLT